jgi:hypothetical protein
MEVLQRAQLHAVAAAAGCSLAAPSPDIHGTDWTLEHESTSHTADCTATLKVQLKSTATVSPKAILNAESFSFQIKSKQHTKLARTPVTVDRILVVMLVPRDIHRWMASTRTLTKIRHTAYWVNLAGAPTSTAEKTTVTVPVANVFDDHALCGIMERIGKGGHP